VVPGYHGPDQSLERFRKEANDCGYPVLIVSIEEETHNDDDDDDDDDGDSCVVWMYIVESGDGRWWQRHAHCQQ